MKNRMTRSANPTDYSYPDTVATEGASREIVRTFTARQLLALARGLTGYARAHVRRGHDGPAKAFAQRAARYGAAYIAKKGTDR